LAKNLLGVDIGSHSIKIVELAESKKGVELLRYGVSSLPTDTVVEGTLANFPLVVDTLRDLVKKF
jgi:type IV pilus assembly protein PilM